MAQIEVKVPQLSESVAEATLLQWHKKVGDAVARDENLVDIETDKVVLELPAPSAGVIVEIKKGDGATVVADEVIATIDTEAKAGAAAPQAAAPAQAPAPAQPAAPAQAAAPAAGGATGGPAMPAAAKLLAEKGIDPSQVAGTGRDGRITKGDALAATAQPAAATPSALPAVNAPAALPVARVPVNLNGLLEGRAEQRVPMSRLRQRVAERLLQSQQTNAILTTFNEVNMQPVMSLRKKYQEKFEKEHGVRLGFMSFFVKAAVHALKKFPIVNASIDGNDIVYHGYFDIGVAVGSPRGLVVPVIRNADQLSFHQIEQTIGDFGKRAQAGKIGIEELSGGTFSISNGGVFGSMLSTPIINPPQSAILGVHATKERPVVENGQVVIRPINYLALSYDHRIIDGREAVLFLVAIKDALEDPSRLLLDL
ncbi:2-oxoglutarate dehydrogenase complex dihydrolipoyllysine-residue succinyltransferase [Lautropia dentalis]|uniref:Dihydrolipoyllysine-residue succinyltransferase component of 2-oxoglutarate dehydrogenase complex n=1 Tax=Lautropia dentalis TaxID=2490857 RepID=A0A3R8T3Q7_9BURK|nr:2-oxoglutarate dehydrogenase complex dihydrolipoyllysine-residue succinyltransferase [Lautropia dentalis]RRN45618.1 2-oxoglutarate dehydrogenase complex dihydrolipoyllysine-residue succinyltransferase [Lautropia dentalis]